jgi:hypothetical protein
MVNGPGVSPATLAMPPYLNWQAAINDAMEWASGSSFAPNICQREATANDIGRGRKLTFSEALHQKE